MTITKLNLLLGPKYLCFLGLRVSQTVETWDGLYSRTKLGTFPSSNRACNHRLRDQSVGGASFGAGPDTSDRAA